MTAPSPHLPQSVGPAAGRSGEDRPAPAAPGTVVVWSDLACPWGTLAVHRLRAARTRLALEEEVRLDHHVFPLELVNARPTPKQVLDAEVSVLGEHEPALGWRPWARPDAEWPDTVLLALEAVQAAKSEAVGGLAASEQLDWALRRAFFVDSRPVGLLTEVLAVTAECPAVDAAALTEGLARGDGRAAVFADWRLSDSDAVAGSPHLFLPDGGHVHNPGLTVEWTGEKGSKRPVITRDEPDVYEELLRSALAPAG